MWDLLETMRAMLRKFGAEKLAQALPNVSDDMLAPVMNVIQNNPVLRWTIIQRGFWAHGGEYLCSIYARSSKIYLV